jgi:hypothetical protein
MALQMGGGLHGRSAQDKVGSLDNRRQFLQPGLTPLGPQHLTCEHVVYLMPASSASSQVGFLYPGIQRILANNEKAGQRRGTKVRICIFTDTCLCCWWEVEVGLETRTRKWIRNKFSLPVSLSVSAERLWQSLICRWHFSVLHCVGDGNLCCLGSWLGPGGMEEMAWPTSPFCASYAYRATSAKGTPPAHCYEPEPR